MPEIRDELVLDIDAAIASINRLENQLGRFDVPVDLNVDTRSLRTLESDLDDIGDVDIELDTTDFETFDRRLGDIESGVADVVDEVNRLENAADDTNTSFRGVADALGISEREAAALSDELIQSERRASDAENAARELADQLGLSEREAEQFAAAMRRGANETDQAADRAGRLRGALGAIGGVLAGVGVFQAVRVGIDQAVSSLESFSNQRESINAINVVFEEAADTIFEFGETAARSAGLAESEFNNLVVPIGSLLRNFGFDAQEAAEQSVVLTQRAADLASVFNTDVTEALGAVQAALRGEGDPIERFGANVSAARVEAFALAEGLAATKSEIDDQVKLQARLGLILADTARVSGDFVNTSDEAANAQRVLAAEVENARAAIGEALLPALESILDVAPDLVVELEQNLAPAAAAVADSFAAAVPSLAGFATEAIGLFARIPAAFQQLGGIGDAVTGFFEPLTRAPDNFGDAFGNIVESFSNVGDAIDDIEIASTVQDLVASIQAGIPRFAALGGAFSALAGDTDRFESAFDQLARTAGVRGPEALANLVRATLDQRDVLGLAADDVEFLTGRLVELERQLFLLPDAFDQNEARRFAGLIGETVPATQDFTTTLGTLQQVAADTGVSLAELSTSTDPVITGLFNSLEPGQRLTVVIDGLRSGVIDAADAIANELGDALTSLPDIFGQAADGAETSGAEALANIQNQASALASFETNVARIFASGQTALAEFLRTLDPADAATAAADFAADINLAEQTEAVLRGQDAEIAALLDGTFLDAARLADLDDSALELIAGFASTLESPAARDLIFDALERAATLAAARLNGLPIDIPVRFNATGSIQLPSADTLERQITGDGGGGGTSVTFNNEFNNLDPSNTGTEAAILEQQLGTTAALLE